MRGIAEERMKTVWFLFSKLRDAQYAGEFEEFGYYLDAIIPLARSVTQGLQKEFKKSDRFLKWYGDLEKQKNICEYCKRKKAISSEPKEGTKQYEMKNDKQFQFFNKERNVSKLLRLSSSFCNRISKEF